MRVRALDVSSARVDGVLLPMRSCTLVVRTDSNGKRGWDASGWLRSEPDEELRSRADRGCVSVTLVTGDGPLVGTAHIAFGRLAEGGGVAVAFAGVGRLDPWPG